MDPPSYGWGANGEVWNYEENIPELIKLCTQVLSDNPVFFLINSYTTGISGEVLSNILKLNMKKYKGKIVKPEKRKTKKNRPKKTSYSCHWHKASIWNKQLYSKS